MRTYPKGTPINQIFDDIQFINYQERVFSYLEYIGYPDLVIEFEPRDVARSISNAVKIFMKSGGSVRMCAITIFSLTMTEQIIPKAKEQVKH